MQNSDSSPASILAANPLGQIVRPPSRGGDTVDSGLLSLVEQEQYNKHSPRYNQAGLVGIENDSSVDSSPADMRNDSIRIDALNDLIASLSSGSDKSSNSPNNTTSAWQVLTRHIFICFTVYFKTTLIQGFLHDVLKN